MSERLDGALTRAQALKLDFAAESLQRVRGELQGAPGTAVAAGGING